MKSVLKPLLVAGLLASAGFAAFSQAPGHDDCTGMMGAGGHMHEGGHHGSSGKMDHAKMQAGMNKRNAALKAELKLTPAQESAWTTYAAAMVPSADMHAKHADHMADMKTVMDKHHEASKTFYATLTPEQKKVFDANAMHPQGSQHPMSGPHDGKTPMPTKP